ncbi:hypothetical protein Sjap_011403 [Stephania japonica]|uniref:Protein kinase domain-containing protein n=1 Tax=Stephania japonica TaxID=461633 RepID=A0AAP0P823_9MAGN
MPTMALTPLHYSTLLVNVLITISLTSAHSRLNSDGLALLSLKSALTADPTRALRAWSPADPHPCAWPGVACTANTTRVSSLDLSGLRLSGYIPSELALLRSLRRLDLSGNAFSGPLPRQVIASLVSLSHLDLSSNLLNGSIPEEIADLPLLTGTLNLSHNHFSGEVPPGLGRLPVTLSLDFRFNDLAGEIPQVGSLVNQGPTAFAGNPNLCGFPLKNLCKANTSNPDSEEEESPRRTKIIAPENPRNPSSDSRRSSGGLVTVPILSGISVVIGAVTVSVLLIRRRGKMGSSGKRVGRRMELEGLLRASAYVVGKSRSGIVYKVVGVGGCSGVVAVRRLSEGGATWRFREFEADVEAVGRVKHQNIVRLRAYYFADDEKLLVSDFVANGCLYSALHGGHSNSSLPLSWAARLKIAQGTARGLTYIHECKHTHGGLKSSKILLGDNLQPQISGFGLNRLVSNTNKTKEPMLKKQNSKHNFMSSSNGIGSKAIYSASYVAPEARMSGTKVTQKCDVYAFGIVLMEVLTGRSPEVRPESDGEKGLESFVRRAFREEWPLSEIIDPGLLCEVHAKKQVLAAFHIALNCTELVPEMRPRMRNVLESLDCIGM